MDPGERALRRRPAQRHRHPQRRRRPLSAGCGRQAGERRAYFGSGVGRRAGGARKARGRRPIEPKHFSEHWHDCLRDLGIRPRGLYATKDTAMTVALATGREDVVLWLVNQTGVAVETLRRHYGKFITKPDRGMWERLGPRLSERRLAVVA